MAKEILLYSGIYDWTTESLIQKLEEAINENVELRVNSGGGSVFAGWGGCAKISEHGNVTIKVDGIAASMAGIYCLFADRVECLDVSRFMLHRGQAYIENEEDQKRLDSINKDVKAKMKAKLNENAFKEVTGYSIDNLFESDKDCWMNAKEAKKIGLVDKINKLNPSEAIAFNDMMYRVAAELKNEIPKEKKNENSNTMTLAEFKAQHPAIYAEAFNAGISQEKDRVEAILVYSEIDPAGVKAAIEAGKPLTQKQMSEFSMKLFSADALTKLQKETAKPIETPAPAGEKTEKEKEAAAFENKLMESLKAHGRIKDGGEKAHVAYAKTVLN